MNTMDYSCLFKDVAVHTKVAKLMRIKNLLSAIFSVLCIASLIGRALGSEQTEKITDGILSVAFALSLLAVAVFHLYFFAVISKYRKQQQLGEDEIDLVFASINEKYSKHFASVKKLAWACTIVAVIGFVLFITLLATAGEGEEVDMPLEAALGLLLFLGAIITESVAITLKQSSFAKKTVDEVEQVRQYLLTVQGYTPDMIAKKKRKIFTNMHDTQKFLKYLYPDDGIRKSIQQLVAVVIMPMTLVCAIIGGVGAVLAADDNLTALYIAISAGAGVIIVGTTIYAVLYYRLVARQRAIFEADRERYELHIQLADVYKASQKQSNIAVGIIAAAVVTLAIIIAQFGTKTASEIGGLVFLGLVVFLIATIIATVIITKKARALARPIEQQIDLQAMEATNFTKEKDDLL